MKSLIILIYLFLFPSTICYCQREPITDLNYIDSGKFDSIFRKGYSIRIPNTYFVVSFNHTLSSLTLVPEVSKAYREIRTFNRLVPIYFLYINKGVVTGVPGDEQEYFKNIFDLDTLKDKNIHFVQSNSLYTKLNVNTLMTKWFYIYNHNLVAGATSIKLHGLSDMFYKLPNEYVTIDQPRKILIKQHGIRLNTERDIILPFKDNKLLYITDLNNTIHILNLSNGQFETSFDKKKFNPYLFYASRISKSTNNSNLAYQDIIDNYLRDPIFLSGAFYTNDFVYVSTGIEVSVPWKDSYYAGLSYMTYINELGEKEKVKYDIIGETYPILLKLDSTLSLVEAYPVDITSYPKINRIGQHAGFWGGLDKGFYLLQDSVLIIDNNPDASLPLLRILPQANHAFSAFKLKDGRFHFEKFLPATFDNNYTKYMDWHSRTNYFFFKNDLYGNFCVDRNIYRLNKKKFFKFSLRGLGLSPIKEVLPGFAEDTTRLKVDFRLITIQPIFNDKLLMALYFFQDRLTMEILRKNKETEQLQSIQISEIKGLPGLSDWGKDSYVPKNKDGLCIHNDKIYVNAFDDGKYYIYEYPIIKKY